MSDTLTQPAAEVAVWSAVPTFLAADVAATVRWYVEKLGFTLAGSFPAQEPFAYASLVRGRAEIMLLSMPDYRKTDLSAQRPAGIWDAYLRTSGVRALYDAWRGEPFIHMPLKRQPYGNWEFEVRDPNGYLLVFGGDE
jgi:catechol 2,3-dioxygenase-like lactoylglutathione lyase family enzyme